MANRKVYLGNLHMDTTEREVRDLASECGKVVEVFLKVDDRQRKCFAFVEFETEGDAEECKRKLKDKDVGGRSLHVGEYKSTAKDGVAGRSPTNTLFVGQMPPEVTETELREKFESYGKIKEIRMGNKRSSDNRVHCFVEFEDKYSAEDVMKEAKTLVIGGSVPKLDYDAGFNPNGPPPERRRPGGYNDRDRYDRGGRYESPGRRYDDRRYPRYDDRDRRYGGRYDDRDYDSRRGGDRRGGYGRDRSFSRRRSYSPRRY